MYKIEWRIIKEYPNYAISNYGDVMNIKTRKILKSCPNKYGYFRVNIINHSGCKQLYIHRLVCIEFIPNILNLKEVNHIDEDKSNNCVENLEWCDRKYNCNHGTRNKRGSTMRSGEYSSVSKKIICINSNEIFLSALDASKKYNIPQPNITMCCQGKLKSAGRLPNGEKAIWKYLDLA